MVAGGAYPSHRGPVKSRRPSGLPTVVTGQESAMSTDDKVIRFPGPSRPRPDAEASSPSPGLPAEVAQALAALSEDQRKALSLVGSGLAFVLVAIKPTERGADFFTAVHGEATDLRNALPHLAGVIERACGRKGI